MFVVYFHTRSFFFVCSYMLHNLFHLIIEHNLNLFSICWYSLLIDVSGLFFILHFCCSVFIVLHIYVAHCLYNLNRFVKLCTHILHMISLLFIVNTCKLFVFFHCSYMLFIVYRCIDMRFNKNGFLWTSNYQKQRWHKIFLIYDISIVHWYQIYTYIQHGWLYMY